MYGTDHKPSSAKFFITSRQRPPFLCVCHSILVHVRPKQNGFVHHFLPIVCCCSRNMPCIVLPSSEPPVQLCAQQLPASAVQLPSRILSSGHSYSNSDFSHSLLRWSLDCHELAICDQWHSSGEWGTCRLDTTLLVAGSAALGAR